MEREYTLIVGRDLSFKDPQYWKDFLKRYLGIDDVYCCLGNLGLPLKKDDYSSMIISHFLEGYYPTVIDDKILKLYKDLEGYDNLKNLFLHSTSHPVIEYFINHADYHLLYIDKDGKMFSSRAVEKDEIINKIKTDFGFKK